VAREAVERNDNPFGRPTPRSVRWGIFGARKVLGGIRLVISSTVDERMKGVPVLGRARL